MIVGHYMGNDGQQLMDGVPKIRVQVGPHTAMGSSEKPCIVLELAEEIPTGPHKGKQRQFDIYLVEEDIQRLKEAIKMAEAERELTNQSGGVNHG